MNKDELAFPCGLDDGSMQPLHYGMTLRDYFAAKAMNGFLVGDAILEESDTSEQWIEKTAFASYQMADAMLRAREQQ